MINREYTSVSELWDVEGVIFTMRFAKVGAEEAFKRVLGGDPRPRENAIQWIGGKAVFRLLSRDKRRG
jgi:hypothetical protein